METIKAKKILYPVKYNGNMWFGIDYNMNLYRGCHHGCIYCDSRSIKYHIDNFDKVRVKEDCIQILENDLRRVKHYGVISMGAMSDSYNKLEEKLQVTRSALELIDKHHQGLSLETKSDLILRDLDILKRISKRNNCIIKFTITTYDDELSKIIEPNVSVSSKRFKALKELSDNGIYTGILLTPMLPFLTDTEENIIEIVKKAHECGAKFIISMFGVTLQFNQRDYYFDKLKEYFPEVYQQTLKLYKHEYHFKGRNSNHLKYVLERECKKYNILYKMDDIIKAYKVDNNPEQLTLF